MQNREVNQGVWFVLAASVLWGTTGTAQALAPQSAQPYTIGAVRLLTGGLAMLALAALRGTLRKETLRLPLLATLVAAAGVAGYQASFFAGVARTGVAVGTVVTIGSSPVLAGLLAYLVYGEKPGWRWLAATLLAVSGCLLLMAPQANTLQRVDPPGVLLALLAGGAYATFTVVSKNLVTGRSPDGVMAVVFTLGAVALLPVLLISDVSWLAQPRGLLVALHLGVVATAAAYSLFVRGLIRLPVSTAATLSLAEPLTASLLGVFLLGERLPLLAVAGIALIFSGLIILTIQRPVQPAPSPVQE